MTIHTALLLCACLACACMVSGFDLQVQHPPPPPPEKPTPAPFEAGVTPELVATDVPGLLAAPAVDEHLYYYAPHERWYRWALNHWYEAFSWDGHWFPPEKLPPGFQLEKPFKKSPGSK